MKIYVSLLFAVTCFAIAGCDQGASSSHGPVAVIDLDAVAKKLGRDKQILQMIEQRQGTLNEQLTATQNSLIQQLNQKKSEFGELSEEETKQLVLLQKYMKSKMNSVTEVQIKQAAAPTNTKK